MKMYPLMTSAVKQTLLFFWLGISVFGLIACESDNTPFTQLKGNAQGSTFSIIYEPISDADYIESIDSIIAVIDQSMSLWDSSSVIVSVNDSKDAIEVDNHFKVVFDRSRFFYEVSDGAFDPTLGPLIDAWGFARKNNEQLPNEEEVDSLLSFVGFNNFSIQENVITKKINQAEINFNAIAQGYTVDIINEYLLSMGIENFLIELGGEIRARGLNQFGLKWKVGIERPDFNSTSTKNAIKTVVGLSNESLATSGSYRKFFEKDGKKFSHTLDPKTGKPVTHNLLSVAVIADNAMDADAYATMFMVIGRDSSIAMADSLGLKIQCIYDENGSMKIQYSQGFKDLVLQEN